jgi:lipopolysaccharide/colanic/teichoic acid biosynthesis glycosyltransferase
MKSHYDILRQTLLPKLNGRQIDADTSGIKATNGEQESGLECESSFNRILCLERKRTERSGNPFALALLDVRPLWSGLEDWEKETLCRTIGSGGRETDVAGWYTERTAIGIILTALGTSSRSAIQSSLAQRIGERLRAAVGPVKAGKIRISFHFYPEEYGTDRPGAEADVILYPDLAIQNTSKSASAILKRVLNLAGSAGATLVFLPLLLCIALIIRMTSRGPAFFRQRRIGQFGREFTFLKFRTMYYNCDSEIHKDYVQRFISANSEYTSKNQDSGPVYKIVADPRVTPIGRFLRKTSLDELPQLLNVLKGDMSLVGPRPAIPYEVSSYRYWHRRRFIEAKPGITGLWQVYGRSRTTFDEMVRLDIRYGREQSILLDIKILLKTPFVLLTGAY